jgi:hypothetical protein
LLRDPFCRRVRCHIDPDKLPPSQPDNDQNVELDKADGRNHDGHVLGDGRLSHRKAELEQLAMNVRCTPKPIVHAHPPDQRSQFRMDSRPACRGAGFPTPVAAKPSAMPTHQGLWPDDHHGLEDRRAPTIKLDEEQAVAVRELDATAYLALHHGQLMPQRGILCFKSAFGLEDRDEEHVQEEKYQRDHPGRR